MFRVAILGLGYVGLPTAVVLADKGLSVLGIDVNPGVVEIVNSGRAHIVEPQLDQMLAKVVKNGNFVAETELSPCEVYVIAVPTPFKDGHKPDTTYVQSATRMIAPHLKTGDLVILESTSPVGTSEQIDAWLVALRPDLKFPNEHRDSADVNIAHCPERILPGNVLYEVVHNDRIIGGISSKCSKMAMAFYKKAVVGNCFIANARTAELAKLAENSFRDVNIAFANELGLICEKLDIDVWQLIQLTNHHPRVNILQPGAGVGGHCIAVDPWFIVDSAPEEARLIRTAREINDGKPGWVVNQLKLNLDQNPDATVACFGLSYKPDIDDLRESPSVQIVSGLRTHVSGSLLVCDPYFDQLPDGILGPKVQQRPIEEAVKEADILVFLTRHSDFQNIGEMDLSGKQIFDVCGLFASQ